MLEIPGSVDNTVDLNVCRSDEIEDKVRSHHENPVAHGFQPGVTEDASDAGMMAECSDALIEGIGECRGPGRTVVRDELENVQ